MAHPDVSYAFRSSHCGRLIEHAEVAAWGSEIKAMRQKTDRRINSDRAARLTRIIAAVQLNATIRLNALAEEFGVSTETIRRDLDLLSREGKIHRTYGGAAAALGVDRSLTERMEANVVARDLIARSAAGMVRPGEVLFISSGVTSLQFAQHLGETGHVLTVLTTSLIVAATLGRCPSIRVVLAPGDYDPSEQAVFGPETQAFLRRFRVDAVFYGASGLTPDGPSESRSAVAWNLRAMIDMAERNVLLIDQSKFGLFHLERIIALGDVDVIVTDAAPAVALHDAIQTAGVDLCICEAEALPAFVE
ncbi:transcriptional regulator, DeoR family [Faunimonas pinastri]|uniref:Transcriptional regulator, DeoR family n=1 Tax=Faunimonas pinastri TaxID=1855383 RepID=A0A1H9DY64_9HYPH|nr:DeoR/GlpR family DNA-binding transcription regulator [Faunimonas pinastri]SEQ18267.1 transcriptional regulator, DeoR family [Faunimonas pinastri]